MKSSNKHKPIIISAVILLIVGYLVYTGIRDTMVFYLTVSEVMAKPPSDLSGTLKVGGLVTADSVQWDPKTLKLSFNLEDPQSHLTVHYAGVVPDSFKPGAEVIVEGTYHAPGTFSAVTIMPKCASKYE